MLHQKPLRPEDLNEKQWSNQVFSTARRTPGIAPQHGWKLNYHTYKSAKSPTGFPDWVLCRERVIFAELKRHRQKPTEAQKEWLTGLARAGAEVYLWQPLDAQEIARILGPLTLRPPSTEDQPGFLYDIRAGTSWTPRSLWTSAGERADAHDNEQFQVGDAA